MEPPLQVGVTEVGLERTCSPAVTQLAAEIRVVEDLADERPECLEVGRVVESAGPVSPSITWSTIPPTALATTAVPFSIASATVRPKPSAMLFWVTIGRVALQCVDDRGVLLQVVHRQAHQLNPSADCVGQTRASGSSSPRAPARPRDRRQPPTRPDRPARVRRRDRSRRGSANASITPIMSFITSQRETCTTIGVSGPEGGPVRTMSHIRSTRPGEPSV